MKKQFKCLMLIGIAGILGFATQSVLAEDEKSISGTICRDRFNQDNVSYDTVGNIRNDVNGSNWVTCPIVRDNMAGQSQHFAHTVRVRLHKRNSATTWCILVSNSISGRVGTSMLGSVSGVGYQTIYIPKMISSYNSGLMNIACRLNDDDSIVGINYHER